MPAEYAPALPNRSGEELYNSPQPTAPQHEGLYNSPQPTAPQQEGLQGVCRCSQYAAARVFVGAVASVVAVVLHSNVLALLWWYGVVGCYVTYHSCSQYAVVDVLALQCVLHQSFRMAGPVLESFIHRGSC